jgi:hypothetical protein
MKARYISAGVLMAAGMLAVGLHQTGTSIGPAQAVAADSKHTFAVHGIGAMSCNQMTTGLQNQDPAMRGALASWMFGYVSAINRSDSGVYDMTPVQEQAALVNMVVGVCQKHQTTPVESVVDAVFQVLGKAKLTTESPDIVVSVAKNNAIIRQATLQQLQQVLVAKKYMPSSAANGTFGPVTQAALVKYQAAEHLPQTGVPDAATIVRALVETPS